MIDFTNNLEIQATIKHKTILSCFIRLDKETMLNALLSDSIYLNGRYYKVPEKALLQLLINEKYGNTYLELEKIEI